MIDAYDLLFKQYPKEKFLNDGLEAIIYIEDHHLDKQWEKQKYNLLNNQELFVRGYGRDATGTDAILTFYKNLFGHENIKKDSNNNAAPTKLISTLTKYCKKINIDLKDKQRIQNYQVSHLFGRTKNALLFNAAWNVAYIPKFLDPFTGHESQGDHKIEIYDQFQISFKKKFKKYIDDYNFFVDQHVTEEQLEEALKKSKKEINKLKKPERFKQDVREEWSKII